MPRWTDDETKLLREIYHSKTRDELEEIFKRTGQAISWKAKELKMPKKIGYRKLNHFKELTNEEAAWLAGLIDGDGCLTYSNDKRNGAIRPILSIANTHENTMKWIHKRLELSKLIKSKDNWRPRFSIGISAFRTLKYLLLQIAPYLRIKKKQAKLMLEFIEVKIQRNNHSRLIEIRDETYRLNGLTGSNGQGDKHQNLF